MRIKTGRFVGDGGLVYLPIGFVPDFFFLLDHATNALLYYWFEDMEDLEASGSQEGVKDAAGTKTKLADDGGIVAYDSGSEGPSIAEWEASTSYTARSATAHGDYVKPTGSGVTEEGDAADTQAIFECVTAGTSGSSEPAWPVEIGGQVNDNGVYWERVNVAHERLGYQGVRVAAALQTDGNSYYYLALQGEKANHGDVTGWTGGVQGA